MIENICYAGNSNDEQFPDEISKNVDANDIKELRTLVEQTEQNKEPVICETSLDNCKMQRVFIGKFSHSTIVDNIYIM